MTDQIPSDRILNMRALVLDQKQESRIRLTQVQERSLLPGEVKVRIKAAALNHRDEWCRQGRYPNTADGVILGSDGAGVVSEAGVNVPDSLVGQEVIINPALNWGDDQKAQGMDFEILGMPRNGTFAEYVIVPADRIFQKPAYLTWEEAAALPLAGLTAFRAISYQGNLTENEKLLVTGFGGGVAQFATQFGLAMGAEVYVSSSSGDKLAKAKSIGAFASFNYKEESWVAEALAVTNGFDLLIDGAGGNSLNDLIDVAKPGGKIVVYGATLGNPDQVVARKIFWKQLKLVGTTMGSDSDFKAMIDFVTVHEIRPIIDQVYSFDQAVLAFGRMNAGEQMGKIVLTP